MNGRSWRKATRQNILAASLYMAYRPADDNRRWSELTTKEIECWCSCAAYVESKLIRR